MTGYQLWLSLVCDSLDIIADCNNETEFANDLTWYNLYRLGKTPMQAAKEVYKYHLSQMKVG